MTNDAATRNEWRAFVRILYRAMMMVVPVLKGMIDGWKDGGGQSDEGY